MNLAFALSHIRPSVVIASMKNYSPCCCTWICLFNPSRSSAHSINCLSVIYRIAFFQGSQLRLDAGDKRLRRAWVGKLLAQRLHLLLHRTGLYALLECRCLSRLSRRFTGMVLRDHRFMGTTLLFLFPVFVGHAVGMLEPDIFVVGSGYPLPIYYVALMNFLVHLVLDQFLPLVPNFPASVPSSLTFILGGYFGKVGLMVYPPPPFAGSDGVIHALRVQFGQT